MPARQAGMRQTHAWTSGKDGTANEKPGLPFLSDGPAVRRFAVTRNRCRIAGWTDFGNRWTAHENSRPTSGCITSLGILHYPGQVYATRDLRLDRFHSSVPPQNVPLPCSRFTPLLPPVLDAEHGQVVVLLRPSRKQVHGRADVFEDLLGMGTWL